MLFDVHAHLHLSQFAVDLPSVIERARNAGVNYILESGLEIESNKKSLALAERFKEIKPSLGFYPIDALKLSEQQIEENLDFIRMNKNKVWAIGEVGLDFSEGRADEKKQKEIFSKIIKLGEEIKKPLVIHTRKAEADCVEMLESSNLRDVIFHCFTGNFNLVKKIEDNGWYLSIPPIILRSLHFQNIVQKVSISNLLTETDSPYLAPPPKTRNEPAFVKFSVERISEIKNLTLEETKKLLFRNFQNIFLKQF